MPLRLPVCPPLFSLLLTTRISWCILDIMTMKEKKRIENLLKARLKDKIAMSKASMGIDALRAKFGRPSAGFDSLRLLRQLRASR